MIYEKERRYIIPFDDVPSPRAHMPEISVEARRGNFSEVETGFPEEVAVQEAKRCLSCRRCLGCALCWAECKPEAIDFHIPDETLELEFDDVALTGGQDNAFERIDKKLGYGTYPEVITDLQFEHMLSPTGPTGGLVLSPRDGDIPARLAIVQGYLRPDDDYLLSSLIFGVNEAILALHSTQGLRMHLISPQCQAFRDKALPTANTLPGLTLVDGKPISVNRKGEEGPLTLTYSEDGQEKKAEVDLLVILTRPKLTRDLETLSKRLGRPVI